MAYIKKMVIQGFKSFARKTEIPFDKGINVVIGPNGSGKSNISDALCFALGRLSIKSMRAAKAKNLIFMGSKYAKPAKEAIVDLVFDNSDRSFSIDKDEVHLARIVRRNGQSIYKINGEVKTRAEVIELLAQAGVDPHGFNLILQGQIQSVVKMHPEERRKIIEEVAGIAIYESRKEKSLKELEKTDERLKEISTVLRERTAYLRNLEQERAQAQKFKDLELTIKRAKASILSKKKEDKEKEVSHLVKSMEEKFKEVEKIKDKTSKLKEEIDSKSKKIEEINTHIQKSTGLEQEKLHEQISDLRAEIEGLRVRKEGYENRKVEVEKRIAELSNGLPSMEEEIKELREKTPLMAKKAEEVKKKKEELQKIEEERKRALTLKSELNSLRERIRDKEGFLNRIEGESGSILEVMESLSIDLKTKGEEQCSKNIGNFRKELDEKKRLIEEIDEEILKNEKTFSVSESEISRAEEIKSKVKDLDICPLCQSKITEEHLSHVNKDSDERIRKAKDEIQKADEKIRDLRGKKNSLVEEIKNIENSISDLVSEMQKHKNIEEKKLQLKKIVEDEKRVKEEILDLKEKLDSLEKKSVDLNSIQERYERKMMEIEEISSRTEENLDTTLLYKERELENVKNIIKRSKADRKEIEEHIMEISGRLKDRGETLRDREEKERELNERFKKMFHEREVIQKEIQEKNHEYSELQQEIRALEEQINYLKIGKAKFDAEIESLQIDLQEFPGIELIKGSLNYLQERLQKAQNDISKIGSINLRALEVYDQVKEEYDKVYEKVQTLENEKAEILKIIEEIDKKKKRAFMKTFKAMNELFTRNFSKLSTKGIAYLELENKEDIFSGGVNIVVRLAKGKYFDVTSLSGGEQTLVALSLLFAIQEYKPYHFYVFDEIDAALDKRNSERLAGLLSQYMQSGQYIVVTHNDAIITNSNILYGVSMHDGVSKILSLKV